MKIELRQYWPMIKRVFWRVLGGSVALLVILILLFHGRPPTLEEWRILIEIAAIVTAGLWAYVTFVRERHDYPLISTEHEITHLRLDEDKTLLRVCVTLHNDGRTLVPLPLVVVYARQICPFPRRLAHALKDAREARSEQEVWDQIREGLLEDVFSQREGVVGWNEIGYRKFEREKGEFELEPRETDRLYADFILLSKPDTVEVVSAVKNVRDDTPWGWVRRTVKELEVDDGREET